MNINTEAMLKKHRKANEATAQYQSQIAENDRAMADDMYEIRKLKDKLATVQNRQDKRVLEQDRLRGLKAKYQAEARDAAILAMYSGADFIKTSTGKEYQGASLEAAYVMALAIKEYEAKAGRMVGLKVAGGITTADEAVAYYTIVKEVLGEKWLSKEYFRIGASRLANNLLGEILGEETKFF